MAPNRSVLCFGILDHPNCSVQRKASLRCSHQGAPPFCSSLFFFVLENYFICEVSKSRRNSHRRFDRPILTYLVFCLHSPALPQNGNVASTCAMFVGVDLKFHICSFRQCHAFLKVRKLGFPIPKTVERFKMGVNSWIAIVSWYKQKGTKMEKCNSM